MKKNILFFITFAVFSVWIILIYSSCAALVQTGGNFLEGEYFTYETTAIYRSSESNKPRFELREKKLKTGECFFELIDNNTPGFILRGNLPDTDSEYRRYNGFLELNHADMLASHLNGWNEFSLELLGSIRVWEWGNRLLLQIDDPVERIQVSEGRIRHKGSRISGQEALRNLRNRRERILAVIEWMNERPDLPFFQSSKEFDEYWKKFLFPELVPKKTRPSVYNEAGAEWFRADEINWNASYTKENFPEMLWEIRDQGALLRDWEEASYWFYLEYQWEILLKEFDGVILYKI